LANVRICPCARKCIYKRFANNPSTICAKANILILSLALKIYIAILPEALKSSTLTFIAHAFIMHFEFDVNVKNYRRKLVQSQREEYSRVYELNGTYI